MLRDFSKEDIADAIKLGIYYLEGGIREFADWSKKIIEDMGEEVRPYLKEIYDKSNAELERLLRAEQNPVEASIVPETQESADVKHFENLKGVEQQNTFFETDDIVRDLNTAKKIAGRELTAEEKCKIVELDIEIEKLKKQIEDIKAEQAFKVIKERAAQKYAHMSKEEILAEREQLVAKLNELFAKERPLKDCGGKSGVAISIHSDKQTDTGDQVNKQANIHARIVDNNLFIKGWEKLKIGDTANETLLLIGTPTYKQKDINGHDRWIYEIEKKGMLSSTIYSNTVVIVDNKVVEIIPDSDWKEVAKQQSEQEKNYGGINRTVYFFGMFGVGVINGVFAAAAQGEPGIAFLGLIITVTASFILVVNRLHNIGKSGWLSLLIIIPIANLFVGIPCLILPEGYQDTKKLDTAGKIIVGILIGLGVLSVAGLVFYFTT